MSTFFYFDVQVNGISHCQLNWVGKEKITIFYPSGEFATEYLLTDAIDADLNKKHQRKIKIAFAIDGLKPAQHVSKRVGRFEVTPLEKKQDKPHLETAKPKKPLPKIITASGLTILKLRFPKMRDLEHIIECLLNPALFHLDYVKDRFSLRHLRKVKDYGLSLPHWRPEKLEKSIEAGMLDGDWKTSKRFYYF